MPVNWIPKVQRLQDDIAEEEARLEAIRFRQSLERRETPLVGWQPGMTKTEAQPTLPLWEPRIGLPTRTGVNQFVQPEGGLGLGISQAPILWQPPTERRTITPRMAQPTWRPPTAEPATLDYSQFAEEPEYEKPSWWRVGLEKATAPFRWLHEQVEVPGAAILTAPWSPDVPRKAGESWLDYEKRQYEAWQAPKFLKGGVEFAASLPLFLIPYGGLSIAGTKFIGQAARAASLARTARVIEATGKIIPKVERAMGYPISKPLSLAGKGVTRAVTRPVALEVAREGERGISVGLLNLKPLSRLAEEGFNVAHTRRMAERWGRVPGLQWIIRKIDPSVLAYTPEARLTVAYSRQLDMSEAGVRALLMPEILTLREPKLIFGIDDLGFAKAVKPKTIGASTDLDSIIRFPGKYILNAEQLQYIKTHNKIWSPMREALKREGILENELATELGEGGYLGRIALEFTDKATGKTIKLRSGGRAVGVKQPMEKPRQIENYADAIELGFRYETDPRAVLYARLNQGFKALVDKEFVGEMATQAGGRLIGTKALPERLARDGAFRQVSNTKFVIDRLRRAVRGEKLTPQSLRAIRRKNPEIADFLENRARNLPAPKDVEQLSLSLEGVKGEIEGIQQHLVTDKARRLVGLIKKTGWRKGEISNLTIKQYRELTGKSPLPNILTADKKHVRWEYSLDDIATQHGYTSGEALKEGIERASEDMARLAGLTRERSYLAGELGAMGETEIQAANIKATISRLSGQLKHERKLFLDAKQKAKVAFEKTRLPSAREAFVWSPGMRGYIFPRQTAEYINRTLGPIGNSWVRTASNINAMIRMVQTGIDLGPYFLQGLPTLVTNPKVWGKAVGTSMEGLFQPRTFYRFLNQPEHQATLAKLIPEGFSLNVAEFVEAAPIFAKIPGIGGMFNRWGNWFNFAIDGGRLLEAEALLALPSIKAAGDAGVKGVVEHLGKKWGVMSTRWLGIPEGQRRVENAVLFYSSRYTRSVLAMTKDVLRGGMQGTMARDMAGKMLLGMTLTYYGLCKALNQEPNLDPSTGRFMTIRIGTENVGFGSSYIAMVRLAGNIMRTLAENPEGFITLDSRDQPLVRFYRSRVAPMTGVAWDTITGKTFIGDPVDSVASFSKYVALRQMLPFWLQGHAQGLVGAGPMPGAGIIPADFLGMRAWPMQPWERRENLRQYYAETEYNKTWQELKVLDRRKLEAKHEDLKNITQEAWQQGITKGRPSQVAYGQWRAEHDQVNNAYENALWELQAQFDKGERTGYEFRLSAQKLGASRRFALDRIDERPEYEDVIAALNEPRTEPEISPQFEDIAYNIYMKLMFSGDLEKGVDEYDFREADRRRQWFINTYGEETYRYVQERLNEGRNIPPLMRLYYQAQEVMRPYWQVRDEVEAMFSKEWADSPKVQSLISKQRKIMRLRNPDIAKFYMLFYSRS